MNSYASSPSMLPGLKCETNEDTLERLGFQEIDRGDRPAVADDRILEGRLGGSADGLAGKTAGRAEPMN